MQPTKRSVSNHANSLLIFFAKKKKKTKDVINSSNTDFFLIVKIDDDKSLYNLFLPFNHFKAHIEGI